MAVPAYPGVYEATQPDGTRFKMRLRGDEFFKWHETADGYAIVQDNADGFWKYAAPSADKLSIVPLPDAIVGVHEPKSLGIEPGILAYPETLQKTISRRNIVANNDIPNKEKDNAESPARIPISGVGTINNIVILAAFSDHWDDVNGTILSTKGRTAAEYDALFNKQGYSEGQAVGSVRDYYNEVSYGKLEINSIVFSWVKLPNNEAYYGSNDGYGWDVRPQEMVYDAIEATETAGFNFSQGDSDGDGWIDCLTIIHSGHGEEWSGNPATLIWSHQWELQTVNTKDGVKMLRYHTSPALRGETINTNIIRIGVICHEMGHFFGLPDLYDYSNKTLGIGAWGIMAFGSWNGGDGKSPAHFCAWSKYMLGFLQPERMHSQTGVSLQSASLYPIAHMYRDGMADGEYFLVENRTKSGFDNSSNISPGIIIYHINEKSNNNDLDIWPHPVVKIEEADGNDSLGLQNVVSEPGDVWNSGSGIAGGFRDQTGNQTTNAMSYQTGYYSRSDDPVFYSYITLDNFSAAGETMTYDAKTLRASVLSQTVTQPDYSVSWPASANASMYELQEGVPVTLASFSDGAENEDFMYDNWNIGGSVQRSNAGRRTGSYSYVLQVYDNARLYSTVQSMTLTHPFLLASNTAIRFYYLSCLDVGNGYLKLQISNDDGITWKTLGAYSGFVDIWTASTISYAAMNAAGMNIGDSCIIRFVANFENVWGWSQFPAYGFAIDDVEISNTTIAAYGNWTTLEDALPGTSYALSDKADGEYAYRVQAYANDAWQGFGGIGVTSVTATERTVTFTTDGTPGALISGNTTQTVYSGTDCDPVSVTVPENYTFTGWMLDGNIYSTDNPITVTNVHDDMILTATFALKTYTLTYIAADHGSLLGSAVQIVPHGFDGEAVEAVPDTGYRFTVWSDARTDNPRIDANVTGNLSVTAEFERVHYILELDKVGNGDIQLNVSVVVLPWSGNVPEGSNVFLKAIPMSGYKFTGWTGGRTTTLNPINFEMDMAYSITANFVKEGSVEGEGEQQNEGEEGEPANEGEDEGEPVSEGEDEGEDSVEGEGESTDEGESEGESEDTAGCCSPQDTRKSIKQILSDWLLIGASVMMLLAANTTKK